jgi:predicted DNA-binding transcriptional regulator AlpA
MSVKINEINYLTTTEVLHQISTSRQTLWRWRQEGKIPKGHRYRGRQILFSPEEVEAIKDFANRIEPIERVDSNQLRLFNHVGSKS